MRKKEEITIGEEKITVKELTPELVQNIFSAFDVNRLPTMAERLLDSPIPIEVVEACTGISSADLQAKFTPTELEKIWAATGRVNDFLSKFIGQLDQVLHLAEKTLTSTGSGGSSAA